MEPFKAREGRQVKLGEQLYFSPFEEEASRRKDPDHSLSYLYASCGFILRGREKVPAVETHRSSLNVLEVILKSGFVHV
ncbi:hypothetical protein CEXT_359381 [Caerostris extrusa]|uniref:Uncharacterized protein n=1 Tax=Caerostris extrusa TaxID=172846 RepID=A0AAV4WMZ9_CAEEX|nr:hypothetical protein CEXT_359381 [Caerostris extrusa]